MAVTLSDPVTSPEAALSELTYSFAIQKFARDEDGDLVVSGVATDGSVDSDRQIVDAGWSGDALATWKSSGANVRMAHDPRRPIGKGLRLDINKDGDGKHWVHSVVVDRDAQRLIEKGVLTAYSVGIANPIIKRDPTGRAPGGIICGGEIAELSIVDRPANKSAYLQIAKAAGDGTPEFTGKLFAPADVLATVADPESGLTTVELPSDMKLKVTPATLAKMATLKRNLVLQEQAAGHVADALADPAATVTITKGVQFEEELQPEFQAMKAAEAAVYKRDIDTATRRRLAGEGHALPNLSYPIENEGDLENAAALARSGHGDVPAATALIGREARRLGVPNPMKKPSKARKAAAATPDVAKCKCTAGMMDGVPCTSCKAGKRMARKAAKAAGEAKQDAQAVAFPDAEKKKGKMRAVCPGCGAKQNPAHMHCPECGGKLPERPLMVKKNHEFMCLGCGHELDKGEPHCPGCGKENPGYLPEADRKIPANIEADKSAGKDRVAKAKKKSGKGKMPFGGNQAKPFGAEDEKPDAKAEKRRKGKGKGRSPAEGVTGHETMPLPPHREPDGAPVEQFENDAHLEDGDQQMKAAMRHKSLGIEPHLAVLHDLTCPAFSPASVEKALPHASFAGIDTEYWATLALKAASGSDMAVAMQRYNDAQVLSKAAVTLKMADPEVMYRIRAAGHEAFLEANGLGKTFRDATPGPGTAPTPGHVMPQSFRRPYVAAGHAAESPQAEPARTFPVISDHPQAQDFHRDYLSAGHASESPDNSGRPEPMPTGAGGRIEPRGMTASGMQQRDYEQAVSTMHDHLSRVAPGMCAMSPPMGSTQKPGQPVPEAVGGPEPHKAKASKADKAAAKAAQKARKARKAARAAARKADARRSKLARQVIKGKISVDEGRVKLGWEPLGTPESALKAAAPGLPVQGEMIAAQPALDAETLAAAFKAATAPLAKRVKAQDKALRKNAKVLNALAAQPDTSQAPFRGAGVYKASAAPAAPRTAAEAAEQAQTGHLQRLHHDWRNSHIPEVREAAYREINSILGINPQIQSPGNLNPFTN